MVGFKGGCSCGAVRFTISEYLYVLACHCDACKKRTGGAFGVSVVVESPNVTEFHGETKTFLRKAESGRSVPYEFCPKCGATVRWRIETTSNRQIFAGGSFDDAHGFSLAGEMYTDKAIPWARLGCDLSRPGESDDSMRATMLKNAKGLR